MTAEMATRARTAWRLLVVGGHTRTIGKTQLVCDVIRAFPRAVWIAGKVTQYGHGVCAQNGADCDCKPTEHVCALDWEARRDSGTDSARFLEAGAARSFWLRTKQGYLAEGLPLLRKALDDAVASADRTANDDDRTHRTAAVIVESNSLMQFVKPSLYFAVIDPRKDDFKQSAQIALDRASALVLRGELGQDRSPAPLWMRLPAELLREKPSVLQREGEALPEPLRELVDRMLEAPPSVIL